MTNGKNIALFFSSSLSEHSQSTLEKQTKLFCFKKGDVIVRKGQKVGGAYLLKSGTLRIYTLDTSGNEKPIYNLSAGEICLFSINCILKQVVYPAWVTVDTDSAEVIAIPTTAFRSLYDNEPYVREYVLNALSERIFDLMSAIEETSIYDINHRINSFLVRACPDDQVLNISHQDIATRLGTAREVVSRHLKQLEKRGYLKLSRMKITLLLPEELAALSDNNPDESL